MNLGRNSRGKTRTTPANPQPPTLASGEQLRLLWPPGTRTPLRLDSAPPPSTGLLSSSSSNHRRSTRWQQASMVVEKMRREKKEGKEEEWGHVWSERKEGGKLHFSPSLSTNLKQAPNSPATKSLLSLGHTKQHQGARYKTTSDTQTPTPQTTGNDFLK